MIRRALKLRPYLETLVLKHKQEWEKDNTSKRSKRLKASAIMPAICRDENKLGDKDWVVLEAFGDILQSAIPVAGKVTIIMATILYAGRYDELVAVGLLLYICLAVLF
ncbi:hypothetical protein DER46DRAFT_578721 [Fusarium sp. MPI-SDFR-AT-0072]|nr:hypothetical protein DER46DRAFT_578721 [Fusarium sp. MPI-SDFR-AT-0072]